MTSLSYPQVWFTYGPQTKEDSMLASLFNAGATGIRLTFSYGTPELQLERAAQVRRISLQEGKQVFIVADLQGEKCRFAMIPGHDEIKVRKGDIAVLSRSSSPSLKPLRLPLQLPQYIDTLSAGDIILEGDGALWLKVLEIVEDGARCEFGIDGTVHPGRGIIVQNEKFSPRSLTEKDLSDLRAIAESDAFDAVAISFVARAEDIHSVRDCAAKQNRNLSVVAKIETQLGIDNLDQILEAADLLMAARGDLALSRPWVELPDAVSLIAAKAKQAKKPWVLATQLAEGLERFAFPTRAEICDLAHWITSGAHGVMLSYETAFGPRPVDAVSCVRKIVDRYCANQATIHPSSTI